MLAVVGWLLGWLVTLIAGLMAVLWAYKEFSMGVCHSKKMLHGQTAVVTGGNGGIGFETAKDLARRGARVVLGCRSKERGLKAVKDIVAATGNKSVELMMLDLGSLQSVRDFSREVNTTLDKVDLLVNNAGIPPQKGAKLSQDGYDVVLQTNHFSHFLLTHLIKETLLKSSAPRIINVASVASRYMKKPGHPEGTIDYSSIKKGAEYPIDQVYGVSKFMNVLYSQEIARRWGPEGIKSYSLHPGAVRTEIFSNMELPPWFLALPQPIQAGFRTFVIVLGYIYGKTSAQGAQTSVYCCVEDGLVNGEYYSDCRLAPWYVTNPEMKNPAFGAQMWSFSEQLLGI